MQLGTERKALGRQTVSMQGIAEAGGKSHHSHQTNKTHLYGESYLFLYVVLLGLEPERAYSV